MVQSEKYLSLAYLSIQMGKQTMIMADQVLLSLYSKK